MALGGGCWTMVLRARPGRDEDERTVVRRLSRARKGPRDAVMRARMIELSWSGLRVPAIAVEVDCSQKTVRCWRAAGVTEGSFPTAPVMALQTPWRDRDGAAMSRYMTKAARRRPSQSLNPGCIACPQGLPGTIPGSSRSTIHRLSYRAW
ncbi:helix-turn-helix domain-containing protein [Streptomyces chartreusis]